MLLPRSGPTGSAVPRPKPGVGLPRLSMRRIGGPSRMCRCLARPLQPAGAAAVELAAGAQSEAPSPTDSQPQRQPELLTKLVKAHAARISSLCVLKDGSSVKKVVSSGLDKGLLTTRLTLEPRHRQLHSLSSVEDGMNGSSDVPISRHLQVTRLAAPGGPVFSLVRQRNPPEGSVFDPASHVLYVGNAAKEVIAWEVRPIVPDGETSEASFQTIATGYTGWVRALALMGKWLFSCGCNYLVQHDTSYPIPQEVMRLPLFKGDIQAITTSGSHVVVGTSDGVLRTWEVSPKTGALRLVGEAQGAHSSRITGLAVHGNTVYSVGSDGWLKGWHLEALRLVAAVPDAHDGEKVHAVCVGADGLLYTGGDDQLVRCWRPLNPALDFLACLEPIGEDGRRNGTSFALAELPAVGQPLAGHSAGVRVLAAGSKELLVSGDAEGDMCLWALPPRVFK